MSFFGPETPGPFAVLSENAVNRNLNLASKQIVNENSIYLRDYDESLCDLINDYLDIDCTDEILLVKSANFKRDKVYIESLKNWPRILEKKFCLIKPVYICFISDINEYEFYEVNNKTYNLTKICCCFVKKFDKIIIKNCLKYFEKCFDSFREFIVNLVKNPQSCKEYLLIIQRVADLNTLPFYNQIIQDWMLNDTKYTKFIETMQNEYFSIKWEIEILKYNIQSKYNWYKHLQQKYPYPFDEKNSIISRNSISSLDMVNGIRELQEGVFKYQDVDDCIELNDRLLCISGYYKANEKFILAERKHNEYRKRIKPKLSAKQEKDLKYEIYEVSMQLSSDIRDLIR